MASTKVLIERVRKVYPSADGRPTAAVDDISLAIQPGELFFLLGPSGCGKTTLLRMVAGFIEPTSGRIAFEDDAGVRDVTYLAPEKRNTGMVFQSYALWPHMTVEQNVAFGLDVRGVTKAEKAQRVREALASVRMEQYAARKPTQLSGGQQQRVALARALVIRPSVLLLDEPLSNLDARLRLELRSEIRRVCKSAGITTIYVTHDQKEALSMADRVAVLAAGKVVQVGTPRELYQAPTTRFVAEFLGETNILPGTVIAAGPAGAKVQTAIGELASSNPAGMPHPQAGASVLVSIRPESLLVAKGASGVGGAGGAGARSENLIAGEVIDTTYLGDVVQAQVRVGGETLHVARADGDVKTGPISLRVDPQHVVMLPADDGVPAPVNAMPAAAALAEVP